MKLFNQQDLVDSKNSRNIARFNKNSKERAREIQDIADLSSFTLPQGLRPLHHCKDFHYKKIKLDQFTEKQLAPRK